MSLMAAVGQNLPSDWQRMNPNAEVQLFDIPRSSSLYNLLANKVAGPFNLSIKQIVRVQNPYLYGQFLLKKLEYQTDRNASILELFHDTGASKIDSIVKDNLDWRRAHRVRFGRGVSFSPSPSYANKQSSRDNGSDRAMIIADVIIGISQRTNSTVTLPSGNCDTTVGNGNKVYVKYYDNEFYPKYVVYYTNRGQLHGGSTRYVTYDADDFYDLDDF